MSELPVPYRPDPGDLDKQEERRDDGRQKRTRSRRSREHSPEILSSDDCLAGLSRMAGLVALGLLDTSQANSIRAIYQAILRAHEKGEAAGPGAVADADLLEMARENPKILRLLEPLLSDEQIDFIMREDEEDDGGEA